MFRNLSFFVLIFSVLKINGKTLDVVSIDENWICRVKTSCQDCLREPQCSWCTTYNKCFSEELVDDDYCEDGITRQTNFSLSLNDNAKCACAGDEIVSNCHPPDDAEALECSGRGSCHCGRCFCNVPNAENPSKVIVGEYCEFDNYSCDGPKCNEGPYSIHSVQNYEMMEEIYERKLDEVDIDNPEEEQI